MKHFFVLLILSISFTQYLNAQTLVELQAKKAELETKAAPVKAEVDAIQSEIDAVNAQIAKFPGWYTGSFGTIGFNLTGLNNWVANPNPNSRTSTILGSFNGYANKIADKYFWRNNGFLNLGWQKLDLQVPGEPDADYQPTVDVLNITSLFGYNLNPKLAASVLGEYRTSVINNFNNPGYLDLGVGFTYTPMSNLVFVIHPVNYNFIFADDDTQFTSSLGCKIVGDYNTVLTKGVKFRSNLTSFISYEGSNLSNYTWTNGFSLDVIKGLGVGFEFALRSNKQEIDDLQSYYILGLAYNL